MNRINNHGNITKEVKTMVSILGHRISLIRPEKIQKPILPKQRWKIAYNSRPKTIKHSISQELGYAWKGRMIS